MCTTGAPVRRPISSARVVLPDPAGPSMHSSRPRPEGRRRSSTSSSTRSALAAGHPVRRCRARLRMSAISASRSSSSGPGACSALGRAARASGVCRSGWSRRSRYGAGAAADAAVAQQPGEHEQHDRERGQDHAEPDLGLNTRWTAQSVTAAAISLNIRSVAVSHAAAGRRVRARPRMAGVAPRFR